MSYTSKNEKLLGLIEPEEIVKFCEAHVARSVRLGWFAASLHLKEWFSEMVRPSKHVVAIFLQLLNGHFKPGTTNLSTIALDTRGIFRLCLARRTHPLECAWCAWFMHYWRTEKKQLRKVMQIEELVIPKYSVHFVHGLVQHAGAG